MQVMINDLPSSIRSSLTAIRLSETLSSSNIASANMESLDQLDVSLATAFIVKRFHLIGLVEARIQLE